MKKILFILAFVYTIFSYGQGGPKVDAIKFKGDVTTTVRDAIDVPVGETWLIWNTTTGQFEYSESDDTWYDLQGITDGSNSTTFFQISTQALNKIEIGVDGPVGSTDYVRLSGGEETGDPTILYLTNDYAALSGISNADIDATGDGAIITKGYADANYGSGGVTDGDKGEIVVSGGVWSIDTNAVSLGNMADNSITEAEIVDDTVIEADLFISNSPTLGYALTSNGSTGFTWTNPSSFISDGSILEAKLNIDNAPTDNYILAYNQPSLNFKWIDPATLSGGSSLPVDDTTSLVQDPVDGTKEMRIDVGAVSTGTVRTITMPDADVNLGNLGASNLDLTDDYTWTGTHNFPNLTELNGTLKVIGNVTTHFGGLILYQNNASTQTGFLGYSGNSVRMSNVTSAQVLQLLDAGGADFNGNFTSDAFIKDGATSDDILLGDGTTTSLAGLGVGDPDQTLSLGGTGNKDLTISGTGGNTIDLTGVDGVDPDNIESDLTGQPTGSSAITNMVKISLADYNAGTLVAGTDYLIESSPAEVVATATIAMDGWKMYDDQTADAATITLSDCDPGETLTVYINRASAPTLAGTGLTFNQLPNTTAFAAATTMAIEFRVAYDGTTIDYYYVER